MRKVCAPELIRRGLKLFVLAEYVSKCGSERVVHCLPRPGPEVIKLFSCSTQLSMKFSLLINVKMPTIVGILTCMS